MERLRTWKFPLVMALCAMLAHVMMSAIPAMAAPVSPSGQDMSLAEALMIVCTSDGARSQGTLSHDNCSHCTGCVHITAKIPLLPLLAVAYPVAASDVWRFQTDTATGARATPHSLPFAQAPPAIFPNKV